MTGRSGLLLLWLCGRPLWPTKMGESVSHAHQAQARASNPESFLSPATSKWTSSWRSLAPATQNWTYFQDFYTNPICFLIDFVWPPTLTILICKNGSICFLCSPSPSETATPEGIPITCYIKMNLILTISEHMPHRVELTFRILWKSDICSCVFLLVAAIVFDMYCFLLLLLMVTSLLYYFDSFLWLLIDSH